MDYYNIRGIGNGETELSTPGQSLPCLKAFSAAQHHGRLIHTRRNTLQALEGRCLHYWVGQEVVQKLYNLRDLRSVNRRPVLPPLQQCPINFVRGFVNCWPADVNRSHVETI